MTTEVDDFIFIILIESLGSVADVSAPSVLAYFVHDDPGEDPGSVEDFGVDKKVILLDVSLPPKIVQCHFTYATISCDVAGLSRYT